MKKILVIGASGMVASRLVSLWQDKFEITKADEKILDITNENAIKNFFEKNTFDSIANFAAYTNVDGAEAEKGNKEGLVWKLNVNGPKYLAEICKVKNIFLVHISTDFVFSGSEDKPGPYSEDTLLPESEVGIGWYGWTKNRAEKVVSESGCRCAIIRYGYPFRAEEFNLKKDWARNLLKLYNEHNLYPLFSDQIQNIIFIDDMSEPMTKIMQEQIQGVFHLVSKDTSTPYEIGSYLLKKYSGSPVSLEKESMVHFLNEPGRAPRPRLGGLRVEKTENILDMKFKSWKQMTDEFIDAIEKSD